MIDPAERFLARLMLVLYALLAAFVLYMEGCRKASAAPGVTLAWYANPETNIQCYLVYVGRTSGNYTLCTNVGNVTNFTISSLTNGTYFAVISAVDTEGLESEPSIEVYWRLHRIVYRVEQSTNLVDWTSTNIRTNWILDSLTNNVFYRGVLAVNNVVLPVMRTNFMVSGTNITWLPPPQKTTTTKSAPLLPGMTPQAEPQKVTPLMSPKEKGNL